jgi:hypothetical protein
MADGGDASVPKAALFAEISQIDQSSGRTAGLRHVTKDMKSSLTGGVVYVRPGAWGVARETEMVCGVAPEGKGG